MVRIEFVGDSRNSNLSLVGQTERQNVYGIADGMLALFANVDKSPSDIAWAGGDGHKVGSGKNSDQ